MSNVSKDRKFSYLLNLFIELDTWARKHDIKIFLDWGTLLGAIRHGGFIPWDFDLDVSIRWGDYQKMLKAWEDDPIPGRDIVSIYRYDDYPSLFTRFVDTETTEIRMNSAWDQGPNGMSLDVFVCVPLPKGEKAKKEFEDKFLTYYELKNPIMLNKETRTEGMRRFFKKTRRKARFIGTKKVIKQLEDEIFSISEEECDEYIEMTGGWRVGCYISKELIGNFTELPFEGHMCYVPEHYLEYIQYCYGPDWRNFPRNRHADDIGYNYVENLDVPYPVYVEDYMQFLEKDDVLATFKKGKKIDLSTMLKRNKVEPEYYELKAEATIAKIESYGSPSQYEASDAAPKELTAAIRKLVGDTNSGKQKYWDVWVPISDDWFSFICRYLWNTDRNYLLFKTIEKWIRHEARALPADAQTIKDDNDFFLATQNAIDYQNVEMAKELKAEIEKHHLTTWRTDVFELYLLKQDIGTEDGKRAFIEYATEAYERKSSGSELKHYYAYALALQGRMDEAIPIFQDVLDNCGDGMILQRAAAEGKELGIV